MTRVENAGRPASEVENLIDENGARIDIDQTATIGNTHDQERAVASTGPANWSRYGLIALGILILIFLVFQTMRGGAGTDMVPGTPTVAPGASQEVQTTPAPDAPPAQ